jgi:hypothetical protein
MCTYAEYNTHTFYVYTRTAVYASQQTAREKFYNATAVYSLCRPNEKQYMYIHEHIIIIIIYVVFAYNTYTRACVSVCVCVCVAIWRITEQQGIPSSHTAKDSAADGPEESAYNAERYIMCGGHIVLIFKLYGRLPQITRGKANADRHRKHNIVRVRVCCGVRRYILHIYEMSKYIHFYFVI